MTAAPDPARLARLLAEPMLAEALALLNPPGEETRLVGGIVRSTLLGESTDDIDLATTLLPEAVMAQARAAGWKAIPTGIEHGTVTLLKADHQFEVTTLRSDVETDGRHAVVAFSRDFRADAARRDFTINAMSYGRDGRLHDAFGGMADLVARHVRFIGDPETRLREDFLRGLRFFRFSARFGGGRLDEAGFAAIQRLRGGFSRLSRERVREEWLKLLMTPLVLAVLAPLDKAGLWPDLLGVDADLPRFAARARLQERHPAFEWPALARLAALLPAQSLRMAGLQDRLRLSNPETAWLHHLAAAEAMIAEAPANLAARLAEFHPDAAPEAIRLAASRDEADPQRWLALLPAVAAHPPFLLGGRDLIAVGLAPGPQLGASLQALREAWLKAGAPAGEAAQRQLLARFLRG